MWTTYLRTYGRILSQKYMRSIKPVNHLEYSDDLFNYTRCRFVRNEKHVLAQRRVVFDVQALGHCAAKAVDAKACVKIEKFPDGMFNRTMLLTMDDGAQVVAKIPCPSAGRSHYTVASEVATMDFARNVLKIPVPKVYAWSSNARDNPIGAEYIVMEKVNGIELEHVWHDLGPKDRFEIVKAIAAIQKSWTSVSFQQYGSLYLSDNVQQSNIPCPLYTDDTGRGIFDSRYVVGQSTGREWSDDGRNDIELDRGPWSTLQEFHKAIGERERACILQLHQLPTSPITLRGPGTSIPTRGKKLKAVDCYMSLLPYILPDDRDISSSHIWHGDLHAGNIFVDIAEPTKIVGIIDWQSTEIAPLYLQARRLQIIDCAGPAGKSMTGPDWPANFAQLSPVEKQQAESVYADQSLAVMYNIFTSRQNPRLYTALLFRDTTSGILLWLASKLLVDGDAVYLDQVVKLRTTWSALPGSQGRPYPFAFSDQDLEDIEAGYEGANRGIEAMDAVLDAAQEFITRQGTVHPGKYDEAMNALSQLEEQIIDRFSTCEEDKELWKKMWPFDNEYPCH